MFDSNLVTSKNKNSSYEKNNNIKLMNVLIKLKKNFTWKKFLKNRFASYVDMLIELEELRKSKKPRGLKKNGAWFQATALFESSSKLRAALDKPSILPRVIVT